MRRRVGSVVWDDRRCDWRSRTAAVAVQVDDVVSSAIQKGGRSSVVSVLENDDAFASARILMAGYRTGSYHRGHLSGPRGSLDQYLLASPSVNDLLPVGCGENPLLLHHRWRLGHDLFRVNTVGDDGGATDAVGCHTAGIHHDVLGWRNFF